MIINNYISFIRYASCLLYCKYNKLSFLPKCLISNYQPGPNNPKWAATPFREIPKNIDILRQTARLLPIAALFLDFSYLIMNIFGSKSGHF